MRLPVLKKDSCMECNACYSVCPQEAMVLV